MSRRCDLCGRGPRKVIRRSHSKRATNSRQHINLQSKTIDGLKKKVCTKCIKTISLKGKVPVKKVTKKVVKKMTKKATKK